jgi:hypothetical protein
MGHKYADVGFDKNGVAHTAAIDMENQEIRLPASEDGQLITINEASSSNVTKVGKIWVFDHVNSAYDRQLKATGIINVNPHAVYGWVGVLEIDPEQDFWTDIQQMPAIDTNYDDQMAAIADINADNQERRNKVNWGRWNLAWNNSGHWARSQLQSPNDPHWSNSDRGHRWGSRPNAARTRSGVYTSLVPERKLVEVGERVVDVTALPMMRQITISVEASALQPNTDFALSIDGVLVDLTATGTTSAGTDYQGKTTVMSGPSGAATAEFDIPAGIAAGERPIKMFSTSDPEESYAISMFTSRGMRETRQKELMGIISISEVDEVVTQTQWHYGDPLAQTWAVKSGIKWISGVRLYFQSKDPTLPVTVQMRRTVNGYPSRHVIQSKTLEPADVNISDDASVATDFYFPNLVGYQPGEYCFVVISNCQSYNLWYAKQGEKDIDTGQVVRQQPHDGVLFTSPNNSYWEGMADSDLKFEVMEAAFENSGQIVFNQISGVQAGQMIASVTEFIPDNCNLRWAYSLNGGSTWLPFIPGMTTDLGAISTQVDLRVDVSGIGGTFQLSESGAGLILLLNDPSADHIGHNGLLEDAANEIVYYVELGADGVNGAGQRSVTPYASIDNGATWFELKVPAGYEPVAIGDGVFMEYKFATPGEASVSGATNASPIVITSADHGFTENMKVTIASVTGNTAANGDWIIKNVDDDTFELYDPDTGAASSGSGEYSSGGTINLADFEQLRYRLHLETTNRARTPRCRLPRGYAI